MKQSNNDKVSSELAGTSMDVLIEDDVQSPAITAVDVVEALRMSLKAVLVLSNSPRAIDAKHLLYQFRLLSDCLKAYDVCVKDNAIAVDQLTEDKASDVELQKIGTQYTMTMNQVVGYMDMCEQLNGQMANTGIIAVPFWFHEQYVEMQKMNVALVDQTDSLLATLGEVEKKMQEEKGTVAELGIEMPQRKSIITGTTVPYIAGETGPRLGDEHLDAEHIYIPPVRKR